MEAPDILSKLKQAGRLAPADLARVTRLVQEQSRSPEEALVELQLLPEDELAFFLGEAHGVPFTRLGRVRVPPRALKLFGLERMLRDLLVPVALPDGGLLLAVAFPSRAPELPPLVEYFRCPVSLAVSTPSEIRAVLGRLRAAEGPPPGPAAAPASDTELLRALGHLLLEAAEGRFTNVHVMTGAEGFDLGLRRDGLLESREMPLLPADQQRLLDLVRRLAGLDPRDRKAPRTGRFRLPVSDRESLNLEVSFVPAIAGERLVIRLLETPGRPRSLEELGFAGQALARIRRLLLQPAGGLFVVAGPGRSGRSATLAALLSELPHDRAVFSVEDPVEQRLPGIHQLQVDASLPGEEGSLAALLSAALAQDADAVMVGRLSEPPAIAGAVSAAFGGCLVLGAVTASDALSALHLLLERGAEPFLLGSALRGVLAQRLVRTLCSSCRRPVYRMPEELVRAKDRLGLTGGTLFEPAGCIRCGHSGWAGCTVLEELLVSSPALAEALHDRRSHAELRLWLAERGHRSLAANGYSLALAGLTTPEEVERVLGGLATDT